MLPEWIDLETQYIPDNYIMHVRGKVGDAVPLLAPGGRAILENPEGKILLMYRADFHKWGFPGGMAEIGESATNCVLREVREETGLSLTSYQPFAFSSDPSIESVKYPNGHVIQAFSLLLHGIAWTGELECSEESLDLQFFSLDKLPDLYPAESIALDYFHRFKTTGQFQVY